MALLTKPYVLCYKISMSGNDQNDHSEARADEAHIKRERAKARELRSSQWWRQQIGPGLCHHCGQKFVKTELTMDHLIPVARGGKSSKNNVVPSCKPCNQTRGHKLDVERAFNNLSGTSDEE